MSDSKKKTTNTYNIIDEERAKEENHGEYVQDFGGVETVFCFLITDFIHPYWKYWLRSEPTFGGLVHYKDKDKWNEKDELFWTKGRFVRNHSRVDKTEWGSVTLVLAELQLYQVARSKYPSATHFFLLSGDSFPLRSPGYIKSFISSHQVHHISIVKLFDEDSDYVCRAPFAIKESLQFKLLNISQVSFLLAAREEENSILKALITDKYPMRCVKGKNLGVPAPDETYIQTALFHADLLLDRVNMNEQICGFDGEFHAAVLKSPDLRKWIADTLADKLPDTLFFVRKVVGHERIPLNLKMLYAVKFGEKNTTEKTRKRKRHKGGGSRRMGKKQKRIKGRRVWGK